jgi:CBS domain-containing protein
MQAGDVMTRDVISVEPGTQLRKVVDILLQHRISGVPVIENEEVLGFVGVGDLLHRHEIGTERTSDDRSWWQRLLQADRSPMEYVRSHGDHARDVMDRRVVSVAEDTPLSRLANIFEARHIRRIL